MRIDYRPDIDGLRAIAIVLVLLYHAVNTWVPGGYVGVDIFFVISGYLITRIIFRDLEQEHFSFKSFYARRIRRIFPPINLPGVFRRAKNYPRRKGDLSSRD